MLQNSTYAVLADERLMQNATYADVPGDAGGSDAEDEQNSYIDVQETTLLGGEDMYGMTML